MNFDEYQEKSRKTAIYPDQGSNLVYPTLGLTSEAGEVADKLKKAIRDNDGKLDAERREAMIKEVGDVLWYAAQICTELGVSMDEVAAKNIEKLYSRLDRDKISGSGDDR